MTNNTQPAADDAKHQLKLSMTDIARKWMKKDSEPAPEFFWGDFYDCVFEIMAAAPAQPPIGDVPAFDECAASGESCSYRPDGPKGELQCRYCGKSKSAAPIGDVPADPDEEDIEPTPESERAARNALMRFMLIRCVQLWRTKQDMSEYMLSVFNWFREQGVDDKTLGGGTVNLFAAPIGDVQLSDAQVLALNEGEVFFSESPSKYPEAGHGTQYHAGAPGVLKFARAAIELALSAPRERQEPANVLTDALAEIERLNAIINTPHADDFLKAVSVEAEHQRQRWGAEGDAGKSPADWFWLIGYLGGKALHARASDNAVKAEHHIITTAAACANWHRNMFGKTDMRPGISSPAPESQGGGK